MKLVYKFNYTMISCYYFFVVYFQIFYFALKLILCKNVFRSKPERNLSKGPISSSQQSQTLHISDKQTRSHLGKPNKVQNNNLNKNGKPKETKQLSSKSNIKSTICKTEKPPSLNSNLKTKSVNAHKNKDSSTFKVSAKLCTAKEKGLMSGKTSMKFVDVKEKCSSLKTVKNFTQDKVENLNPESVRAQCNDDNEDKKQCINATVSPKKLSTQKTVLGKENKVLPSWFYDRK